MDANIATNVAIISLQGKIPDESMMLVKDKIGQADDNKAANLLTISFKSPIIGLALGFFFGPLGIDRFYKGDIYLGIAKIALLAIGFITTFIFIGFVILFVLYVWTIADLFLVWKGIKKDNLNKVLMALS